MARTDMEWDIYRVFASQSDRIYPTTLGVSSNNIYRKNAMCHSIHQYLKIWQLWKWLLQLTVTTENSFTEIHFLFTDLTLRIFIQNGSKNRNYVTLLSITEGNIHCVLAFKTVELYPTFMSFSVYRVSVSAHSI